MVKNIKKVKISRKKAIRMIIREYRDFVGYRPNFNEIKEILETVLKENPIWKVTK